VEAGSAGGAAVPTKKTADERKALLAQAVTNRVRMGWRVESQTDYQAVTVKGHRPNNVLHLLLTIFTLGLWGFVWLGVLIFGGEKRGVVAIDEYGNTLIQG
jgi:hypothetical protein